LYPTNQNVVCDAYYFFDCTFHILYVDNC